MMVGGPDEAVERLAPILDVLAPPPDRRARPGLGALRPDRRRPLREDGPQRHRVRDDAGLRRGLRPLRRVRVRARQREDRAPLDAGLGRALVAVRAGRARVRAGGQRPRRASSGYIEDSGEGRWTVEDAMDKDVPTPVHHRRRCTRASTAAATATSPPQANAALRSQFGGHAVKKKPKPDGHARVAETNPLVEGLERLPVHPTTLVIFGAHRRPRPAQAAARALQPRPRGRAARALQPHRRLALGDGRRGLPRAGARVDRASSRAATPDAKVLDALLERDPLRRRHLRRRRRSTSALADVLARVRRGGRASPLNRVFYLSTAPAFFPVIVEQLGEHGLDRREDAEVRVVIEKPFGTNLEEARELNRDVLAVFDERQVFRIDHYLGKETVQNMLAFRFANGMFEPLWNRNYIDHVQITAAEDIGDRLARGLLRQRRARCATSSRTTCSSCSRCCAWSRRSTSPPTRCATRRSRSCTRSTPPDAGARRRDGRARRSTRAGTVGGEEVAAATSRRRACPPDSTHRDLRRAAPRGRQLALGGRAVLPAHGQAAGAQGHRDRGHAQAGAAPRVLAGRARSACSPTSSSSRCSPTRACRCRSARRSPARACASGR